MKCSQMPNGIPCDGAVVKTYVWPGAPRAGICAAHLPRVKQIARAIGLGDASLDFQDPPIPPPAPVNLEAGYKGDSFYPPLPDLLEKLMASEPEPVPATSPTGAAPFASDDDHSMGSGNGP